VILGATARVLEGYDAAGRQHHGHFNRAETAIGSRLLSTVRPIA